MSGDHDWAWAFVVFRDIPGFPGYQAGSDGTVWSRWWPIGNNDEGIDGRHVCQGDRWTRVKGSRNIPTGHRTVGVKTGDGKHIKLSVHRAIASAFFGPCPAGMECRHFPDRNPQNNRAANLAWGTRKENRADMAFHGTLIVGVAHQCAVLDDAKVIAMRELNRRGVTQQEIADRFDVSISLVNGIVRRRRWKHVS